MTNITAKVGKCGEGSIPSLSSQRKVMWKAPPRLFPPLAERTTATRASLAPLRNDPLLRADMGIDIGGQGNKKNSPNRSSADCLEQKTSRRKQVGRHDAAHCAQEQEGCAFSLQPRIVFDVLVPDAPGQKLAENRAWIGRQPKANFRASSLLTVVEMASIASSEHPTS